MDPIFDRLGRLIRSFGDSRERPAATTSSDPFQKEAEEELEEFLRTGREAAKKYTTGNRTTEQQQTTSSGREPPKKNLDPALVRAYAALEIPSDSSWEQINTAHRALLKKHHPDSHSGSEAQVKQATDQSQKINEAYQVLKKHFGR